MITKKTDWKTYFKSKSLRRFGIFLLVAFLFLMLTKLSERYTQVIQFNIDLNGLDDEIVITQDSTHIIETIVQAKGYNLLPFVFNTKNTLPINGKNQVTKNDKTLVFDVRANRHLLTKELGNQIEIISVKPDTLFFKYDVMATKQVPIQLSSDITYVPGYDVLNQLQLSQDSVKLIGSQSMLNTISRVVTNTLELKEVQSDINATIDLERLDKSILIVPSQIDVFGVVKRFTEDSFSIPVELINVPLGKDINYFPKTVDLIYYVSIDAYKELKASDFKVIADFNTLSNNDQRFLDLKIETKSKAVKNTKLNQDRIEFISLN